MADDFIDPHEVDVYAQPRERAYRFIQFDVAQGIARLTLNRPPANVLSIDMMEDIANALEALEYQRDIKIVVLSGSGKYFSAGFELGDHLGDRGYVMLEVFRRIFEGLRKLDKPTLAIVGGPAFGAGCTLAVGCDIVIAGASAKFGHPEIRAGVFNTVAAVIMPRIVGIKKTFEIMLGGASLGASEAVEIGLISKVFPDDHLASEASSIIARFQELSAPVLQLTRKAIYDSQDLPFIEALRVSEDIYLNQLMATDDVEEGLRAVMAKRKPAWKDR
jgi:enoyl-CoA hydratase/carnithine racemase